MRVLDVRSLGALIAPANQQVDRLSGATAIHAITRSEIDAELAQAFTDWRNIAGIAIRQPVDPRLDLRAPLRIRQSFESTVECVRALHFEHGSLYTIGGRM
jgi:hypothetical protein